MGRLTREELEEVARDLNSKLFDAWTRGETDDLYLVYRFEELEIRHDRVS